MVEVEWKAFLRKGVTIMRRYVPGENLENVTVGNGIEPGEGGFVAIDAENPEDQWYITPEYFEEHFTPGWDRAPLFRVSKRGNQ